MIVTGAEIVAEARRWLGTPFIHQQSLRGVGCDCIGLVAGVARALEVREAALWDRDALYRGYGPQPKAGDLLAACRLYLEHIFVTQVALGDILLFKFLKEPMHFGIVTVLEPRSIIHAYSLRGKVIEHSLGGKWARRVVGAYRFRGKVI